MAAGLGALSFAAPASAATSPNSVGDRLVSSENSLIGAHNSPSLAQNPAKPKELVITDRVDLPDYSATVHISTDGGRTWRPSSLVLPPGGGKLYAAAAAFSNKGTLYVLYVILTGPGNNPTSVWIERSNNGGATFDQPSMVNGPYSYQTSLAVDPKTGRVFVAWLQADLEAQTCNLCFAKTGIPIVASHSDDSGHTWSPPAQVSDPGRARIGAPVVRVDSKGNPYVLYVDFGNDRQDWEDLAGTYDGKFTLVLARSDDRGTSFKPGTIVDSDVVPTQRFLVYLPPKPSLAVKGNTIVVAWADGRSGDNAVLVRHSTDGGVTWSTPVQASVPPAGTAGDQDLPAVDIAPDGRVDVLFYDRSMDTHKTSANVVLATSSDSGASFHVVPMSSQPSNRFVGPRFTMLDPEADFGTVISLHSTNNAALGAWTDTRMGTPDTARQDIFFGAIGVVSGTAHKTALGAFAVIGLLAGVAGVAMVLLVRRRARLRPPPFPDLAGATPPGANRAH